MDLIFTKNNDGFAEATYHGITVIGVCNGIDFGTDTITPLTAEVNTGRIRVSVCIVFPDGTVEHKSQLAFSVNKMEFPNAPLFKGELRNEWSDELKTWFVDKLVEKTTPNE